MSSSLNMKFMLLVIGFIVCSSETFTSKTSHDEEDKPLDPAVNCFEGIQIFEGIFKVFDYLSIFEEANLSHEEYHQSLQIFCSERERNASQFFEQPRLTVESISASASYHRNRGRQIEVVISQLCIFKTFFSSCDTDTQKHLTIEETLDVRIQFAQSLIAANLPELAVFPLRDGLAMTHRMDLAHFEKGEEGRASWRRQLETALGFIDLSLGDLAHAATSFKACLSWVPEDLACHHLLGATVLSRGNLREGLHYFDRAVRVHEAMLQQMLGGLGMEMEALVKRAHRPTQETPESNAQSGVSKQRPETSGFSKESWELEDVNAFYQNERDWMVTHILNSVETMTSQQHIRLYERLKKFLERSTNSFDAELHYQLGIGLLKRGFRDAAFHHLSIAGAPWNRPHYAVHAELCLPRVHSSLRALALHLANLDSTLDRILSLPKSSVPAACDLDLAVAGVVPLLPYTNYYPEDEVDQVFFLEGNKRPSLMESLSSVFVSMCPELDQVHYSSPPPMKIASQKNRKRKIGFVSTRFRTHPTAKIALGLMNSLKESKDMNVEVVVLGYPTMVDYWTSMIQKAAHTSVTLTDNRVESVKRVVKAELDVLVFVDLPTDPRTYLLAHSRVAPVQMALAWATLPSTGLRSIDFFVVPELLTVTDMALQRDYGAKVTEQVVYLEGLGPFLPPWLVLQEIEGSAELIDRLEVRSSLLVPQGEPLFVLPVEMHQLHPDFDATLYEILELSPAARIAVVAESASRTTFSTEHNFFRTDAFHPAASQPWLHVLRTRLHKRLGERIRRVWLLPSLPQLEYFSLLAAADAVLDPYPVGAFYPCVQALFLDTPVVTLPSAQRFGLRYAQALYFHFVPDTDAWSHCCTAADSSDYAMKAFSLGLDGEYRRNVSDTIKRTNDILEVEKTHNQDWATLFGHLLHSKFHFLHKDKDSLSTKEYNKEKGTDNDVYQEQKSINDFQDDRLQDFEISLKSQRRRRKRYSNL